MREQLFQLGARLKQLRFRSARGDSEFLSDLSVRITFNVVKHEHRPRPRRKFSYRLLNGFRDERSVAIHLRERGVILDVNLEPREAPDLPQSVQGPVDGNAMSPRSELRVPSVARERSEDLHPDLLRDVSRQLRIPAKPAYNRVNVWRMLRPQSLHRPLVAGNRALEVELVEWHLGRILSHTTSEKSFLAYYGDLHTVQSFANVNLAQSAKQQV